MFKKLRLKLALTNAAVAAVILLAMAAAAYLIIAGIVARQSQESLATITRDLASEDAAGSRFPFNADMGFRGFRPYCFIRIGIDNSILMQDYGAGVTREQMKELADLALENESLVPQGTAGGGEKQARMMTAIRGNTVRLSSGRAFRYSIAGLRPGSMAIYLIFLDMREELALLGAVRLALLACVVGGLLMTLLGGLFLAGRALRPIQASWQKQREFVADASHELRSPLAAIRCNLDVVLDDPAEPVGAKQAYWEGIVEETGRMATLVDELLLLARADSGSIALQTETVDLADVAEAVTGIMKPLAEKKGVALTLDAQEAVCAAGDPARLKQVLMALVDNAVKYTPEGGSVTVAVHRAKDRAAVSVADTGIGIAKEHIGKIFDRFYRVDAARVREGGHGLGLSIAKFIVEKHGGSIAVVSEPGKGSTFTVLLPAV